jgi:ribosomal protein S18 acetylase RimI-like enzyme
MLYCTPMQVTIRLYRESDLERLQEITVEGFEGVSIDRNIEQRHGLVAGRDWKWRKARHIQLDAERDPQGLFVAEADGAIAGYITTWRDVEAGVGFIPNLAVDSRFRGEGIGRRLIEHALDHFRRQGMKYARIETLDQNPIGQKLYPSFGFEEIARQIHYGMPLDGP